MQPCLISPQSPLLPALASPQPPLSRSQLQLRSLPWGCGLCPAGHTKPRLQREVTEGASLFIQHPSPPGPSSCLGFSHNTHSGLRAVCVPGEACWLHAPLSTETAPCLSAMVPHTQWPFPPEAPGSRLGHMRCPVSPQPRAA